MKNDFMVAINQVCHERQLPVEIVLEAVEVALVSAYKRNYGGNSISAKIDQDTGELSIFAEKEVVEEVLDPKNEISLEEARQIDPDVDYGDVVQVESTPANFGRIAAQTTKQVILQRIREAERDALYRSYAEREGEIVHGTVQKVDQHQVTLSLGKVEAYLPRSEQIPTERYSEGQRLRAYVSQVNKTPRGPQIIVSRTHRNFLRRLLEVEVPEIYNGTVEVKAIAREAGYRSKVAVAALQEGVDPVGSCVGMRGVRIQSIVNELNGEKIDVAEWSPLMTKFIANALSPAKVLNVILLDAITGDKTAMVVVPDKQLSLAIGKEGQNARLAAKLTGWRIDIKSAMEAAREALERVSASEEIKARVSNRPEVFSLTSAILSEREEGSELSGGELNLLGEAIELIMQAELAIAREKQEAERAARLQAIAEESKDLLAEAEAILSGVSEEEAETAEAETEPEEVEAAVETEATEVAAEPETETPEVEPEAIAPETETVTETTEPVAAEPEAPEAVTEPAAEEQPTPTETGELTSVLESVVAPKKPKKKTKKRLKAMVVEDETDLDLDALIGGGKKKPKPKRRAPKLDDTLHRVTGKRRRKGEDDWDELDELEY